MTPVLQKTLNKISYDKSMAVVSNSVILPTPAGIPLKLSISFGGIVSVKGEIMPDIEFSMTPKINGQLFASMGVDAQWIKTGVAVKAVVRGALPFSGAVHLDVAQKKLTIRSKISPNTPKFFHVEVVPITIVYHLPKSGVQLPIYFRMKELNVNDSAVLIQKTHELNLFGLRGSVIVERTKSAITWGPFVPLNGKQSILIKLQGQTEIDEEIYFKLINWEPETGLGFFGLEYQTQEELVKYSNLPHWKNEDIDSYFTSSLEQSPEFSKVKVDPVFTKPKKLVAVFEIGNSKSGAIHAKTQITYIHGQKNIGTHNVLYTNIFTHFCRLIWSNNSQYSFTFPTFQQKQVELHASLRAPPRLSHLPSDQEISVLKLSLKTINLDSASSSNGVSIDVRRTARKSWVDQLRKFYNGYISSSLSTTPADYIYKTKIQVQKVTPLVRKVIVSTIDAIKKGKTWSIYTMIPEDFMQKMQQQPYTIDSYVQYVPRFEMLSTILLTPEEHILAEGIAFKAPMLGGFVDPILSDDNPLSYHKNYSLVQDSEFDRSHVDQVFPRGDESELFVDDQDDISEYLSEKDWYSEKPLTPRYPTQFTGKCIVSDNHVTTFDGLPLMIPISPSGSCRLLLAKDCSSENTFAIIGSQNNGQWSAEVYAPNTLIKLVPDRLGKTYQPFVNGQQINFDRQRTHSIGYMDELHTSQYQSLPGRDGVVLAKTRNGGIKLVLKQLGMTIKVESGVVYIKLSPFSFLQGRLCGLCGDFNSDPSNDLYNLSNEPAPSHHSFVLDKLIPSSQCPIETYKNLISTRYSTGCKKDRTLKIDRFNNAGVPQTCLSAQPVLKCASGCKPVGIDIKQIQFKCFEQSLKLPIFEKWDSLRPLDTEDWRTVEGTEPEVITEMVAVPRSCSCPHI
ncbi:hypothetical protein HELRODRAFT_182123 [Helobdella robusta]|uniref:VWFD domain-containing protein n=1 Tax=Helobdella robusta TaxID=6412 RepID=T1FHS7_HELRO|nr:hypothetical protein HELRODRAFT_182123 [Helobdella robusta]ESN91265.1 hypothetical protein HELRODRAFT_182123 [Helobdella robusta]